jgi:hypothetical protein
MKLPVGVDSMSTENDGMHDDSPRPSRYRPTLWAAVHYLFWTALIVALWPLGAIIRLIEKLYRHEQQD